MTLLRLVILMVLACVAPSGAADGDAASANPVRAALMTFTTDDNSYRSSVAAANLAAALQAELSSETAISWVERVELKAAERELELSELGLPDSAGALRRGRFVGADWIVAGSFKGATNQQWNLTVEVIDVRRADVLASFSTAVSRTAHPTLKSALPQMAAVASAIRTASQTAMRRWEAVRGQRTLALLMVLDAEQFEPDIARGVEAAATGSNGWRVARFSRTGQSFGENEMLLLGLVDQNPNLWESLADAYAWGEFAVRRTLTLTGVKIPSLKYQPVLEITLWDRRGESTMVSIEGEGVPSQDAAWAQAEKLCHRAPQELLNALNGSIVNEPVSEVRARIAKSLMERATTGRKDPEYWSRWSRDPERGTRNEILKQARLLETAMFFDPRNRVASEHLLAVRWNATTAYTAPNRFWFLFNQSEDLSSHLERFGLSSLPLPWTGPEIAGRPMVTAYVTSACQLMDLSQLGNKEDFGFPRDMSGEMARKWLRGVSAELARRVIKTAEDSYTRSISYRILTDGLTGNPMGLMLVEPKLRLQCIEALWPAFVSGVPPGSRQQDYEELCRSVTATCAELGLAGREKALLNLLDKPKVAKPITPVRLPRASDWEPRRPTRPSTPPAKP